MGRTPSHVRYSKKCLKTIPTGQVRAEELAYMQAMRRKLGLTWLQLLYRGMGLRREDYLNSREFKE